MQVIFDSNIAMDLGLHEAIILEYLVKDIQYASTVYRSYYLDPMFKSAQDTYYINNKIWLDLSKLLDTLTRTMPFISKDQYIDALQHLNHCEIIQQEVILNVLCISLLDEIEEEFGITKLNKYLPKSYYSKGHIYVIKQDNLYKIGRSSNIKQRLWQFKDAEVISTYETIDCIKDEKILHKKFKAKRHHGEWFNLNNEDLASIKNFEFSQGLNQ